MFFFIPPICWPSFSPPFFAVKQTKQFLERMLRLTSDWNPWLFALSLYIYLYTYVWDSTTQLCIGDYNKQLKVTIRVLHEPIRIQRNVTGMSMVLSITHNDSMLHVRSQPVWRTNRCQGAHPLELCVRDLHNSIKVAGSQKIMVNGGLAILANGGDGLFAMLFFLGWSWIITTPDATCMYRRFVGI